MQDYNCCPSPCHYIYDDPYPSIHYTGTEDYFGGSYGFGNDIIIKSYKTFSGLYTGMYAIYGDNREFYNGQQRFLLYHFLTRSSTVSSSSWVIFMQAFLIL